MRKQGFFSSYKIKGVGEKTEQRLLLHFGSVARIAAVPVEDVAALVGTELALRIHRELSPELFPE